MVSRWWVFQGAIPSSTYSVRIFTTCKSYTLRKSDNSDVQKFSKTNTFNFEASKTKMCMSLKTFPSDQMFRAAPGTGIRPCQSKLYPSTSAKPSVNMSSGGVFPSFLLFLGCHVGRPQSHFQVLLWVFQSPAASWAQAGLMAASMSSDCCFWCEKKGEKKMNLTS